MLRKIFGNGKARAEASLIEQPRVQRTVPLIPIHTDEFELQDGTDNPAADEPPPRLQRESARSAQVLELPSKPPATESASQEIYLAEESMPPAEDIQPVSRNEETQSANQLTENLRLASLSKAANGPRKIERLEDLTFIKRTLYDEIKLGPSLKHKICPVERNDGDKVYSLVMQEDLQHNNIVHSLCESLELAGYSRSKEDFIVFGSANVLIGLSRNELIHAARSSGANRGLMAHDESALKEFFENALVFSLENEVSDWHIRIVKAADKSHIAFRVDGVLNYPDRFCASTGLILDMAAYIYNVLGKAGSENSFNENTAQQCNIPYVINGRKITLRWASNQTSKGCKIVFRFLINDDIRSVRSLPELGFLPGQVGMLKTAIGIRGGGMLIAGVVGSGKSTTGQTLMTMQPEGTALYSVEDPVEYDIPGVDQFSVSRPLNDDGNTDPFLAVKRQIKRMDLNAILIGEIRDMQSAGLFRDICESGHSAIATIHAPSAIDMITLRLSSSELGVPRDVIATPGFINLLMYQALLPLNCPFCSLKGTDPKAGVRPEYLEKIQRLFGISADKLKFRNMEGCSECRREDLPKLNGIKGRTVVAEIVELDHTMLKLYRDQRNLELKNYIRSLRTSAFDDPDCTGKTVLEVAMYKVSCGEIDPFEVERKFGSLYQYERDRNASEANHITKAEHVTQTQRIRRTPRHRIAFGKRT